MASSFWRAAARASSRFATFAQAISSTNATAPSKTNKAVLTSPTIASRMGMTATLSPLSIQVGYRRRNSSPRSFIWARACSIVTPGFKRAATIR